MPYLHSRIADKHKASCKDPKSKRLYIRDYDEDTKKRAFTPLGIYCPSCKVIIFDSEPLKPSIDNSKETQVQLNTKAKPKPQQQKPLLKLKPKRKPKTRDKALALARLVKEAEKLGAFVFDCKICKRPTNIDRQNSYLPKDKFTSLSWKGRLLEPIYPDRKYLIEEPVEGTPDDAFDIGISICDVCYKKHFDKYDNPITERGRKADALRIIPYPMSLKELSKYGDAGKCAICNKNILQTTYLSSLFDASDSIAPSIYNRIQMGGESSSICLSKSIQMVKW